VWLIKVEMGSKRCIFLLMEILDSNDEGLSFAKASEMLHMSAGDANSEKCP